MMDSEGCPLPISTEPCAAGSLERNVTSERRLRTTRSLGRPFSETRTGGGSPSPPSWTLTYSMACSAAS